jgi:hypothetical protein
MGYMRHHAIVVTGMHGDWIDRAHAEAARIFPWVSPISDEGVNGAKSFFVPPDGSKEGWGESDEGDARRAQFIAWLNAQRYEDQSSPLDWVEVQYADDNLETLVCRHSDERRPESEPK